MTRFLLDIPAAIKRCPQMPVMVVGGGSGAFGESEALGESGVFALCAVGIARIISFNVL